MSLVDDIKLKMFLFSTENKDCKALDLVKEHIHRIF